ncbi:MAG: hypothetical protein N3D11_13095 [Candidatus Sumerlaeia bacterium]|nr:hypothetical protein [Candidatus Sumerlaeia bacterium]
MAVGPDGAVHLVFWSGVLDVSPANPSTVWYCRRDPVSGRWSAPEIVDDSYTSMGVRLGGRHPSLALAANGTVRVFWHDYRHCVSSLRWINNIELYMDSRPPHGSFSGADIRLTQTAALHDGDNGYVPQAVMYTNGEIFLAWYDYHYNRNLADLFLAKSNPQGDFAAPVPLAAARLTDVTQRGNSISYTLPDIAVDSSGAVHIVWTRDNAAGYGVFYARRGTTGSLASPQMLSTGAATFFDPPHITCSPQGDVFVAYTEYGTPASGAYVQRLRAGWATFDPPVKVTSVQSNQKHADLKTDSTGMLHLVWVDERTGRAEVFYGRFNPTTKTLVEEIKVSTGPSDSARPCIALGPNNRIHIVWTDYRHGMGQIYYRTNTPRAGAKPTWLLYR